MEGGGWRVEGGGWWVEGEGRWVDGGGWSSYYVSRHCTTSVQFIHSAFLPHPPEHDSSVHDLQELRRSVEQESKHVARAQQSLDKVGE